MRIIRMQQADVEAVAEIGATAFQGHGSSAEEATRLREELARPWAHVWIASDREPAPAGFVVTWHVADELHVLNIATDPRWRRRGVARALVEHVLAFARERKARHVLLEVRRSNEAAIALYRSAGFYAMNVRRAYYPDGEDAVEMVLVFDADGRPARRDDEVTA